MNINNVKLIDIKKIKEEKCDLLVFEEKDVKNFNLSRVFTIVSQKKSIRGNHAHKQCSQILQCICGEVEVICFDGRKKNKFILNKNSKAILIPPLIWAQQNYLRDHTIINVYCDRIYEEKIT